MLEPITPLGTQRVGVGGQADDLVAGESDEFGLGVEPLEDGVDGGKGALVQSTGHAGAGPASSDASR